MTPESSPSACIDRLQGPPRLPRVRPRSLPRCATRAHSASISSIHFLTSLHLAAGSSVNGSLGCPQSFIGVSHKEEGLKSVDSAARSPNWYICGPGVARRPRAFRIRVTVPQRLRPLRPKRMILELKPQPTGRLRHHKGRLGVEPDFLNRTPKPICHPEAPRRTSALNTQL
jgi:hypothetical protein